MKKRGMVRRLGMLGAALLLSACAGLQPGAPSPEVAEIVQMSREGRPAAEVLQRLRDGGGVYRLPASELARLREQGVADAVIDAMQQSWVEDARREGYRDGVMDAHGPLFGPWRPWPCAPLRCR